MSLCELLQDHTQKQHLTKTLLLFQANVADLEKKLADKDSEKAELSRTFSQDFELELEKEKNRHEAELQKQVSFTI